MSSALEQVILKQISSHPTSFSFEMTPHGIAIEVHVTRSLHCTQAMCLFLRAAVTVPYTRWQETADIYSPTTLEARCPNNQGVDMAVPSLKTLGEDPSSPLPTSGGSGRPW